MPRLTRRNLLAKTGTGIAIAGAMTTAPGLFAATTASAQQSATSTTKLATAAATQQSVSSPAKLPTSSGKPLMPSVVYIRDAAKGEVVFMVGTQQVVRTDHALVAAISQSASRGIA
jgi:hypothetical protein